MTSTSIGTTRSRRQGLLYLARRAVQMEIGVWQSLYRFVFRRPRVPAGSTGFSYHQPVFGVLLVFIVLSAIEIPVIDLIIHRWAFVRIPVLAAGIWGLTWMIGLLLGFLTRPHAVGSEGVRVRHGAEVDIPLAWDEIDSVVTRKRTVDSSRAARITAGDAGNVLHLRMQQETNVDIVLRPSLEIRLPQGPETVTEIRLYVDDPKRFVSTVHCHL